MKVLFIAIDGLRWDTLQSYLPKLPTFSNLLYHPNNRLYTQCRTRVTSQSGACWSSILSGKDVEVSNADLESDTYQSSRIVPWTLTDRKVSLGVPHRLSTVVSSWTGMDHLLKKHSDCHSFYPGVQSVRQVRHNDRRVCYQTRRLLTSRYPNQLVFAYFMAVDETGHEFGFSSDQYIKSIQRMDTILAKLLLPPVLRDWRVVVTTDHGGLDFTQLSPEQQVAYQKTHPNDSPSLGIHGLQLPAMTQSFLSIYQQGQRGGIDPTPYTLSNYHSLLWGVAPPRDAVG